MYIKFVSIREDVRSSYWFVPTLMALAAVMIALVTLGIDHRAPRGFGERFGLIWGGGAEGARGLLTTIAGSTITVASVIFSIAVVAFAQAATQHGPHILRNFMRDTGNQIVLGSFVATFIYNILVLRTIQTGTGMDFVPNISITVGVLLSLASLGVLIFFIHHATVSIQATEIAANIAKHLSKTIDEEFLEIIGSEPREHAPHAELKKVHDRFEREAASVVASRSGYLQAIDANRLMKIASQHDLVLLLGYRPGLFIIRSTPLVWALPPERLNPRLEKSIRNSFVIGNQRTYTQDAEFAIHQLVEISLRALSPAVNDPFTAIICIDWLGDALSRMAEREFPSRYRYDQDNRLRVITYRPFTFIGMVNAAVDQIRQFANGHVAVRIHLLETLANVIAHTRNSDDRLAVIRQAKMIERQSNDDIPEREDLRDIDERYRELMEV
ncbi:MAG: DUF2254 domain-containing protein [Candidatus Latescibacterota bacterium]